MRKSFEKAVIAIGLAVLLLPIYGWADGQAVGGPFVKLNGQDWTPQHPPIRMAGVILVPIRDFASAIGATVTWDANTKMVKLSRDDAYVQVWVGRNMAVVNNEPEALAVAPVLVGDTLYAPLDVLAKAFGGTVEWDGKTETAAVNLQGTTYKEIIGTLLQSYPGPPPALLIFEKDTSLYRAIALNDSTQLMVAAKGEKAKPAKLTDFVPGDLVHIFVNDEGQTVRVLAEYAQEEGTVQKVEGKDIMLDGARIIRLMDTATITDANGNAVSPDAIGPGARIRARVNPATRETARVVVLRRAASAGPQIRVVGIVNPRPAYKAGETVRARVIGTPGGRATVSIPGVLPETQLQEVKPGYYEADLTLNLPQGEEKKVRLEATLRVQGKLLTATSEWFWIDGKPPQFADPSPEPNSTVNTLRPTISVGFRDEGSGIDLDSVRMWLDNQEVTDHLTFTTRRCTYEPENDIPRGGHTVKVQAADNAGHTGSITWSFNIAPAVNQKIVSVKHNAQGPLGEGETLEITVETTEEGQRCWAAVGNLTIDLQKQDTTQEGHIIYQGSYEVKSNDRIIDGELTAYFIDQGGHQYSMKAELPVTLRGDLPAGVRITKPKPPEKIKKEFTVEGVAKPGSTIHVVVSYYKKAFLTFQGKLAEQTVKADENGVWKTEPIDPRIPLLGKADTYTITAELIEGGKVKARDKQVVEGD